MLAFLALLDLFSHSSCLILILLVNGFDTDLIKCLKLLSLQLYFLLSVHFMSLQQPDSILKHLDLILCLLPHLPLFEHFNTFFYQVCAVVSTWTLGGGAILWSYCSLLGSGLMLTGSALYRFALRFGTAFSGSILAAAFRHHSHLWIGSKQGS